MFLGKNTLETNSTLLNQTLILSPNIKNSSLKVKSFKNLIDIRVPPFLLSELRYLGLTNPMGMDFTILE